MWNLTKIIGKNIFWGLIIILIMSNSGIPSLKFREIVRVDTRSIEFDYVTWTIETIWRKAAQITLGSQRYMTENQQKQVVEDYFNLISQQRELKDTINNIYADPTIINPESFAAPYLN